jgi:16S rRNA U516 pseudouridylate synthase RsuA-like enzyme
MDIKDFFKYFAEIVICKVKSAFVNSTIKIACEEGKTRYIKMIIKKSGNYSISTYQMKKKSLRQKKKYPDYKYSPTRIIIMRKISD